MYQTIKWFILHINKRCINAICSSWNQRQGLLQYRNPSVFLFLLRDNLTTDIYGANLYNRYLAQQLATVTSTTKLVSQRVGSHLTRVVSEEEMVSSAAQCRSILVSRDKNSLRSCWQWNSPHTSVVWCLILVRWFSPCQFMPVSKIGILDLHPQTKNWILKFLPPRQEVSRSLLTRYSIL